MAAGRPTALTPETQAAYLAALKRTWYIDTAADLAGIHRRTIYDWIKRGRREPGSIYAEFSHAVQKTLAESTGECLDAIKADPSWQSRAWLLERRHPERWGSQRKEIADLKRLVAALESQLGILTGTPEAQGGSPAKGG